MGKGCFGGGIRGLRPWVIGFDIFVAVAGDEGSGGEKLFKRGLGKVDFVAGKVWSV